MTSTYKVYNCIIHQRLYAQRKQFYEWFVGFTEGDGCFFLIKQKNSWSIGFKVAVKCSNIRTLIHIKKNLGCGILCWANKEKTMIQYRIRNNEQLFHTIFPIFDQYPMITNKNQDYLIVRQAAQILSVNPIDKAEKLESLALQLKQLRYYRRIQNKSLITRTFSKDLKLYCEDIGISLEWVKNNWLYDLPLGTGPKSFQDFCYKIADQISIYWIMGFIEAEGSFYIVSKDRLKDRLCLGFGISQKTPFVLEILRKRFRISSKVKERLPTKTNRIFFQLDNTNSRANKRIQKLCSKQFVGLKSLQFRIWSRSFDTNNIRLKKRQHLLKKLSIV